MLKQRSVKDVSTIVIYHSRDWDGWTSGELAREAERKANPDARIDAFGWTYGDVLPDVSGYDRVVLVDLTISEKTELGPDYSWMKENAGKLVWIDHHRNAIEALPELKGVPGLRNTDGALSACRLAWALYHPGEDEPRHVRYVGLTDIQKRDDPEFPEAADYALYLNRTYGRDVTLDIAREVMSSDIDAALAKGRELERERAAHEAEVWSEGVHIEHGGRKGILLANGEQPSVVLKDHLMNPGDIDFIVLYQPIAGMEGQYKCSIRVPEGRDFDGAAYAAQWGGGGHRAAAGWVFGGDELRRLAAGRTAFGRIAESALSSGRIRSVGTLKDGWALVQAVNGKYNYANEKGQFMTRRWFDSATEFGNGTATIRRDGCTAKINCDGIAVEVTNEIVHKTGNSPKMR